MVDKVNVVFAWLICDIDWASANAAGSCMETGVVVDCLKHVPIRHDIQVLGEQTVVGVGENVPGVAGWDLREEVI